MFFFKPRLRLFAYAKASQIHGCDFVASATNPVEIFLWSAAVIASLAMFMRDAVNLAEVYQRQDTTISLAISTDANIILPRPAFCVDVHRESVLTYLSAAWATFDDFNVSLTGQTCDVLTLSSADESFWIPAYLLLASYMDADLQIDQTSRIGAPSPFYSSVLDALEVCIKKSNTDLFELVPAIGAALCDSMNIQIFDVTQNDSVGSTPCQPENMLWVGPRPSGTPTSASISASLSADVICFAVPFPMFATPTQAVSVQTNRLGNGFDPLRVHLYFDPNGGECLLAEPSACQYVTATSADYLSENPTTINSVYSIALSLTYSAFNRTASPCSAQSAFKRNAACAANAVERERGCVPLSFFASANSSTSIGPCTMHENLSQYGVAEAWSQCELTTLPACETVVYKSISSAQMNLAILGLESAFGQHELALAITAQPLAFSAVTEDLVLDSDRLIAALGGSMIAWFGGSVICFVHIVVFIISTFHVDRRDPQSEQSSSKLDPFWAYFTMTPIHGLPFASDNRQNKAMVAFWLLIVAAGVALAVRDTFALVSAYSAQPTEVDIDVDHDALVSLDKLALCFTISRTAPDLVNRVFDGDESNDPFQPINVTAFADTLAAFAESPAMARMQAGRYDLAGGDLPLILTARLYLYLSAIGDYDKGVLTEYEATDRMLQPNNAAVDQELAMLDAFVDKQRLDLFALTKLVAASFCRWINPTLTAFLFDENSATFIAEAADLCSNFDGLAWFGSQPAIQVNRGLQSDSVGDKLCYSLAPFVGLLRDLQHDYLEVTLDATQLTEGTTEVVQLLTDVEFDVRGGAGAVDATFADGTSSDARQILAYENTFSLQNRSTKICASTDRFSCAMSCAASRIADTRACVSIAFPRAVYDANRLELPICRAYRSIEDILDILAASDAGSSNASVTELTSSWSDCLAACATPCETETYKLAYAAPNANPLNFIEASTMGTNASYSMAIKSGSAPCWHFTERLSMDLNAAVWSFGGSLGLWIGASFMALLHLPLYGLSVLLARKARRQQVRMVDRSAMTTPFRAEKLSNIHTDSRIKRFISLPILRDI